VRAAVAQLAGLGLSYLAKITLSVRDVAITGELSISFKWLAAVTFETTPLAHCRSQELSSLQCDWHVLTPL